ncbi:APC family permease [Affinibrenneria salicis]|uniref:APC family permease n=1 Tax=Affinibrenneria salicis TaxID=2590031 RepID=A0A5J5FW23_9GAMM|nr:APC family permease [Affinibrenneria salicis]KAA8997410.1 APC family permease [Affinibrenneria salicis]
MPQFKKILTARHLILFGLAYMTPIIVLGTFGILAQITEGHTAGAYVLALIAMLFTAYSYSKMAAAFPVNGSAYVYVSKAIGPHIGFLAGWAILLDYLFLPMVIWLIGAVYLSSAFPAIPHYVWLLAFIAVTTLINIVGLKVAGIINALLLLLQVAVLAAFVALALHYILGDASRPFWTLQPFFSERENMLPMLMAGAAVACYSFLGFDAITTLAAETIDAKRNLPRAILFITLLGGAIFVLVSWCVQLAHPGATFANSDSAAFEIARNIGGDIFVTLFMCGLVFGQFSSGIAAQASASRLIYTLGVDGVLSKTLGKLGRFNTPTNAIVLCALIALLALGMDITTSTSFINFGAFLTFALVNAAVIFHYFIHQQRRQGKALALYLLCPLAGIVITLLLLASLDKTAIIMGCVWLACGLLRLILLKRAAHQPQKA